MSPLSYVTRIMTSDLLSLYSLITMFTLPKAYLGCCIEDFDVSFELVDSCVCLLVCPVLFLYVITVVVLDLL
jgi:hypothetical protein